MFYNIGLKKLNLGAGESKKEGYVNVDWQQETNPDVVHDLNNFPYPFRDNSFELVEASHVLEHLDKPFLVMKEFHRIMSPGGILKIKVPHFSRGFTHAEHAHGFDVTFPLYFNKNFTRSGFFGVEFELKSMRFRWFAFSHLLPYMGYEKVFIRMINEVDRFITFLGNISPPVTSRIWCYWVGGFDEIEFIFKSIK